MISHVKSVSIPVSDQDRAVAFYTEKLGFKLVVDLPFNEKVRWIEVRPPSGQTRVVLFCAAAHEDRIGTLSNVILTAPDIEAAYAELLKKGVTFAKPLTKESWGSAAILLDPDGNQLVLSSDQ